MMRYVFIALSLLSFAMTAPDLLKQARGGDTLTSQNSVAKPMSASSGKSVSNLPRYNEMAGRTARAKRSRNGHYVFSARLNGAQADVLVDTGASGVTINISTARRMGIRLKPSDFKYEASTANGVIRYAAATISKIQIGRIYVENVRAAVLPDQSLDTTLLGMSFLNRLKKFEFSNNNLILTQ